MENWFTTTFVYKHLTHKEEIEDVKHFSSDDSSDVFELFASDLEGLRKELAEKDFQQYDVSFSIEQTHAGVEYLSVRFENLMNTL